MINNPGQEVCVLKDLSEISDPDYLFTTRIFDCFLTEHNVVMILEFCPDGNLEDVVSKRGPLAEQEALEVAYQLARGLQFISKRKVVHRDIKPDNVFNKRDAGHMIYKLGDFGFAVKKQINQDIVGTPIFMSPELFREEPYGSEVDVWAYGLLVHYVLFREHYFMDSTENKVKNRVLGQRYQLTPKHLSVISGNTASLLMGCLEFDKRKRIRAETIAEHPAFNPVRDRVSKLMR
jgi:serine/threonine protein kinase